MPRTNWKKKNENLLKDRKAALHWNKTLRDSLGKAFQREYEGLMDCSEAEKVVYLLHQEIDRLPFRVPRVIN
jgi:hypothetical protein